MPLLSVIACSSAPAPPLAVVPRSALCVTSGRVDAAGADLRIDVAETRAVAALATSSGAELSFRYRGPTGRAVLLASGELRRQIGLKLRGKDTCNVVYVMWHIEPTPGVFVSVKANPGESTHRQCRDRGYANLRPTHARDAPRIEPGSAHVLSAWIEGSELRVLADGALVWEGELPPVAFGFDGPAGLRSDNGAFDLRLRVAGAGLAARDGAGRCEPD